MGGDTCTDYKPSAINIFNISILALALASAFSLPFKMYTKLFVHNESIIQPLRTG